MIKKGDKESSELKLDREIKEFQIQETLSVILF